MKTALLSLISVVSVTAWTLAGGSDSLPEAANRIPVLVELFTSEGCSICPPADRFLEKLDHQPLPGAEMIVLSEHVDYWNHIGWKDPYSARFYSQRQNVYAKRFGLDSVYTPQMVVDGSSEFVGSNSDLAEKALARALRVPKIPVHLSSVAANPTDSVHAHLETGVLDASFGPPRVEVYAALALNRAESQVSAGENAGHRLTHVSVVRNLMKIGEFEQGQNFSQDIQMKIDPTVDARNLRLIVFIQRPRQGQVLGAALVHVNTP